MALNIQFQNLNRANSEILKAFNSQAAAKALEAFQPLEAKERARAKLRALQRLKAESKSLSLGDINLNESSLASALAKSEGAELQAMLNLLSSRMIQQNKNTILEFIEKKETKKAARKSTKKKKVTSKKKKKETAQKKTKKTKKKDKKLVDEIVKSVEDYLENVKTRMLKLYDGVLDAVSMKNIRKFFEESIKSVKKYLYEVPVEFLDERLVTPIFNFPSQLKNQIDKTIDNLSQKDEKRTFTAKEIRGILKSSIDTVRDEFNDVLEKSIQDLDQNLQSNIEQEELEKKTWKPQVIVNQSVKEVKKKIHRA